MVTLVLTRLFDRKHQHASFLFSPLPSESNLTERWTVYGYIGLSSKLFPPVFLMEPKKMEIDLSI